MHGIDNMPNERSHQPIIVIIRILIEEIKSHKHSKTVLCSSLYLHNFFYLFEAIEKFLEMRLVPIKMRQGEAKRKKQPAWIHSCRKENSS